MEVNDTNLQTLGVYLETTLNPDPSQRRKAEKNLESVEGNSGFAHLLLTLINHPHFPLHIRQAAAITLKNFVKRNWRIVEGEPSKISDADRQFVKSQIVELMLTSPEAVQRQLAEAVCLIGAEDFPDQWPNLLPDLVQRMRSGDFNMINGVLQTANSLFKRYRHEMRSDELWREIKYVLDNFADPLTELFKASIEYVKSNAANVEALRSGYSVLVSISKIFYSLNVQDLPEYFEDHMGDWMPSFLYLLQTPVPALQTYDDEAGLVEQLQSQICHNVAMYAQKYEEEFQPYLSSFVEAIWHLLIGTNLSMKYDLLVSNAIQFLSCVCERPQYKQLFESGDTLAQICEKIILPNMEFRETDAELFEDNPEEYIRRDIEGSDVNTRRRAASDFVRALCKNFEQIVIQAFSQYIQNVLNQYASDPKTYWRQKNAAIYVVNSIASKGSTVKMGTTQSSELVNLVDFFGAHIKPELDSYESGQPVLLADSLKYLMTFRGQLGKGVLMSVMPICVTLLKHRSVVVHSYAAHVIERILMMKDQNTKLSVITAAEFQPLLGEALQNAFGALNAPESEENQYIMKTIMRILFIERDEIHLYFNQLLSVLAEKVTKSSANPKQPIFNHYMFESLCILIKSVCGKQPQAAQQFNAALFPPIELILKNDVTEFMPYTFQILALLLHYHQEIPESFMELFPFLLVPALWERNGNVPGLVQLLKTYVKMDHQKIVSSLNPMLGIFQKLIASKANDGYGFDLLNSMIDNMTWEDIQGSFRGILTVLFQRLQVAKTPKFVKGLLSFMAHVAWKHGPQLMIDQCDQIQPNLFGMLLEKIVIVDLVRVDDRKFCADGFIRLLCDAPGSMLNGVYSRYWPALLSAILMMFQMPEEGSEAEDAVEIDLESTGYTSTFNQLAYGMIGDLKPPAMPEPKLYLAKSLQKLASSLPANVKEGMHAVDPSVKPILDICLKLANIAF